jgi:hypothetical protein
VRSVRVGENPVVRLRAPGARADVRRARVRDPGLMAVFTERIAITPVDDEAW